MDLPQGINIIGQLTSEWYEYICLIRLEAVGIDVGWYPSLGYRTIIYNKDFHAPIESYSNRDFDKVKQFTIKKVYEYLTENEKVKYL